MQDPPLDLSFWSFLTFLHHGIEEVERHLLWKFYKKIGRNSWSNVPPKWLACIGFLLYKVVHTIGRLRKFNRCREIEFNFLTAWTISIKFGTLVESTWWCILANKTSVWLMKGQHTVTGSCGVRTQHRSHHLPSSGDVWARACNVWLPQCPSCSINVVVHIGKQRLSKPRDCDQILTSSRVKRRPAFLSQWPGEKCEWQRATRAGARILFERIVRRWRDMRRPIPYRTRRMVAWPASGHSCWPTSVQWRTRRTASYRVFYARSFSRSLQQRWPPWGWPGSLSTWRDDRRARCPRPAQVLRFLKSCICTCVKISASV